MLTALPPSSSKTPTSAHKRSQRAKASPGGKSKPTPLSRALSSEQEAQFIARYSHVVRQIAGGFQRKVPRNVLRDDLLAAGMSGLWDAIRKHAHENDGPWSARRSNCARAALP